MKRLRLYLERVRASFLSDLLIFLLVALTLFFFVYTAGHYRALTQSCRLIERAGTEHAVYFAEYFDMSDSQNGAQTRALIQETEEYPGVDSVISMTTINVRCGEESVTLLVCSEKLQAMFPAPVAGVWDISPGSAVVAGGVLRGSRPGDRLTVTGAQGKVSAELLVCGVLPYPSLLPHFGSVSAQLGTDNFFWDYDTVVVGENEMTERWIAECPNYFSTMNNFFVIFTQDVTDEQRQTVCEKLRERGVCYEMADIIGRTRSQIADELLQLLLRPVFYMLIAMISFFGVSILSVYKGLRREAVYYLLGCSHGRMIRSAMGHIGVLIVGAAGLNLWSVII